MTIKNPSANQASDGEASSASKAAFAPAGASFWLEMMTESGRFIAQRLEEDLKAQQAFLGCKTPAEVLQVQADYCETAVEQYAAEVGRILEFMSGTVGAPLVPYKSLYSRGYDDVPV